MVTVVRRRWNIEESFAASDALIDLDEHQVPTRMSWHRWSALDIFDHTFPVL